MKKVVLTLGAGPQLGFITVFLSFFLFSCTNPPENKMVEGLTYCSHQKNIVNGALTDSFPSVVRLQLEGTRTCTGTFISSRTLVTARHCLLKTSSVKIGSAVSTNFFLSDDNMDLAVVQFPENTFTGKPSELASQSLHGDEPITLAGFGQYDVFHNVPTDGRKRVGCNNLQGFADITDKKISYHPNQGQYLHFRSAIKADDGRGMTGQGDSGGPIFVGEKLAGVVSFGGERNKLLSLGDYIFINESSIESNSIYEFDTNLNSAASIQFLRSCSDSLAR